MIAAKGIARVTELIELAEGDATLPSAAREAAKVLAEQIAMLDKPLDDLETEITAAHEASNTNRPKA